MMMVPARRTQLLMTLLIGSAITAVMAWSSLVAHRDGAAASQADLTICLAELKTMNATASGAASSSQPPDDLAVNRRLRAAAIAAHLSDQLASIEPGTPLQRRDSDFTQTPIYVRLNAVTLRQLVEFLHALGSVDNTLRPTDIELSPALTAAPNRNDRSESWTADVTLSYLTRVGTEAPKVASN